MTLRSYRNKQIIALLAAVGLVSLACSLVARPSPTPTVLPTAVVEVTPTSEEVEPSPTNTAAPTAVPVMVDYTSQFEEADCPFTIPVGAEVTCGFLIVPEDRYADAADTIRLAVAIYHSPAATQPNGPTLFLQGGPGSRSVTWSAAFYEVFINPLLVQGDMIFIDHRGSGLSEPSLDCDEIRDVFLQDFQEDWDDDTRASNYIEAFLGCKSRLIQAGANLRVYTTGHAAADIKDLITTLGYQQVNLYGASYGSRLGLAVMRHYPELVRAAVFDSIVPLEVKSYNDTTARANYALETLFAGCTADPRCTAAYPDLESNFYELLAQFDKEPIKIDVDDPDGGEPLNLTVSDATLLNALMWAMHTPEYVAQAPKMIDDIFRGDYEILELVESLPFAGLSNVNVGLRLSVECHDQIFPTTVEELEADISAYPPLADYGYSAIYGSADFLHTACGLWGAAPFDPVNNEPLRSDIPTLILAGQYDPTTPAYYGRQVAENLSRSHFFEFAGKGHTPSIGEADNCALAVALNFLAAPANRPNPPCLAELAQIPFFVPYDGAEPLALEPFTSPAYNLSGMVPAGWEPIENGFYNRNQFLGDPAQIGFQSSGVTPAEWLIFLEDFYQNVGLDAAPESAGSYESNGRVWLLYTAEAHNDRVDIALATMSSGITWLVMMQSDPAERDAFYDGLFLPAIDALGPY